MAYVCFPASTRVLIPRPTRSESSARSRPDWLRTSQNTPGRGRSRTVTGGLALPASNSIGFTTPSSTGSSCPGRPSSVPLATTTVEPSSRAARSPEEMILRSGPSTSCLCPDKTPRVSTPVSPAAHSPQTSPIPHRIARSIRRGPATTPTIRRRPACGLADSRVERPIEPSTRSTERTADGTGPKGRSGAATASSTSTDRTVKAGMKGSDRRRSIRSAARTRTRSRTPGRSVHEAPGAATWHVCSSSPGRTPPQTMVRSGLGAVTSRTSIARTHSARENRS